MTIQTQTKLPAVTTLAAWFGSDRMIAEHIGDLLKGCSWIGIPFAGGMSALLHLEARTMAVNDLHRHVMNVGLVVADQEMKDELVRRLDATLFHLDELAVAQRECLRREADPAYANSGSERSLLNRSGRIDWAVDYFVCSWMARNGTAGTKGEFNTGLSVRWEAGGGDSAVRFRNATESLHQWHQVMRRCTFTTDDAFDFLAKCKDRDGHGLYVDPPFPGPGDGYKFNSGKTAAEQRTWHTRLRDALVGFRVTRVCCRYYRHPLVEELYPEGPWTWHRLKGRTQTNSPVEEVLLVNAPRAEAELF